MSDPVGSLLRGRRRSSASSLSCTPCAPAGLGRGDQSVDLPWSREGLFALQQVRFVGLIVDELTGNGVMAPARLLASPYADHSRLDVMFPNDAPGLVAVLRELGSTSRPA